MSTSVRSGMIFTEKYVSLGVFWPPRKQAPSMMNNLEVFCDVYLPMFEHKSAPMVWCSSFRKSCTLWDGNIISAGVVHQQEDWWILWYFSQSSLYNRHFLLHGLTHRLRGEEILGRSRTRQGGYMQLHVLGRWVIRCVLPSEMWEFGMSI